MTLANILLGITIGVPLMLIAGPVSMMLLDRGLALGARGVAPAVAGVAAADLVLALLASLGAGVVTKLLVPIEGMLTSAAVMILVAIAVWMWRGASSQLAALRGRGVTTRRSERGSAQLVGVGSPRSAAVAAVGESVPAGSVAGEQLPEDLRTAGVRGAHLGGTFFAMAVVNPISLVLLASLVIAGGAGVGTVGWALGMAIGSAISHGAYAFVGAFIAGRLDEVGVARIRLFGAAVVATMAVAMHVGII